MERSISSLMLLPKRRCRVALVAILLVMVLVFGGFSLTPTAHASSRSSAQGEHCAVVIDKLRPGERVSHVVSQQCAQGCQQLVVPGASTLLMTWYINANYGGASTKVYGDAGPCDSSGYGIGFVNSWVSGNWNDDISSFKVWNNCTWSDSYVNANYGGHCEANYGNVSYVGGTMNDKISSFWVASDDVDSSCVPGPYF